MTSSLNGHHKQLSPTKGSGSHSCPARPSNGYNSCRFSGAGPSAAFGVRTRALVAIASAMQCRLDFSMLSAIGQSQNNRLVLLKLPDVQNVFSCYSKQLKNTFPGFSLRVFHIIQCPLCLDCRAGAAFHMNVYQGTFVRHLSILSVVASHPSVFSLSYGPLYPAGKYLFHSAAMRTVR